MNKDEITKLIEATQDGRDLEDGHPISELINWALINNQQTSDFDIGEAFANLEYVIDQLEKVKTMVKLLRHVGGDRY